MRQIHRAGEKLFVDSAGPTLPLTTGCRAHIFVAAIGASSYMFACATPAETMEDWLGGIARALTFYGGVLDGVKQHDREVSGISCAEVD